MKLLEEKVNLFNKIMNLLEEKVKLPTNLMIKKYFKEKNEGKKKKT